MAKVFIGNLPDAAKGNDVEDFFSKYGRIREINLKSGYGKFIHSRIILRLILLWIILLF